MIQVQVPMVEAGRQPVSLPYA